MKKEYIIYKLSEEMKNATRIENELFKKFDVKRGLRNEDGTGVFAKMLMDEGIRVLDAGELPKIILKNEDGKCQSD